MTENSGFSEVMGLKGVPGSRESGKREDFSYKWKQRNAEITEGEMDQS